MLKLTRRSVQVYVKFTFTGVHFWKKAHGKTSYLKYPHRHEFHVTAIKSVETLDREIEFIQLKEQMLAYCRTRYEKTEEPFEFSCEQIAEELSDTFQLASCAVSEDDENGAIVYSFWEGLI